MKMKNNFYGAILFMLIMAVSFSSVVMMAEGTIPQGDTEAAGDDYERIFLRVSVPRTNVYVGERVPLTVLLYITELNVTQVYPPVLDQPEFSFEETVRSSQSTEELHGQSYQVVRFVTAGTPLTTGSVFLKPVSVQCSLSQSQDQEGIVINPARYQMIRGALEVNSPQVKLRVNPLPVAGRPVNFSGGVGQFQVRSETSATEIREGEPLTVRLTVSGSGNLQNIAPPALADSNGFKLFAPQRRSTGRGKVIFEQTVVPLDYTLRNLGPYRLSYFDPDAGRYRVATTNLPLKIKATPGFNPDQAGFDPQGSPEPGKRLAEIKESSVGLGKSQPWLIKQFWFWWLQCLPVAGLLAVLGIRRYRRMRADDPQAQEGKAGKLALQRLAAVRVHLAHQEYERFLNELYGLLREYLSAKWGPETAAITEAAGSNPREFVAGLDPGVWQELQSFLASYHQYRFAGADFTAEQGTALCEAVQRIITALNQMAPIIREPKDGKTSRHTKEARS